LTCSAIGWHPNEYSDSFSVGELNANCEAKIMDDAGKNEVPQGERGEIWIRAPNVMKGYWNRPDATHETLTPDGWLKTGDIAFIDKNGKFFIVDRKKVSVPILELK
jgi:4-coumarate--CoA ligase